MIKRIVLVVGGFLALAILPGCDTLARSQGKFVIAGAFGESVFGYAEYPDSELLWYKPLNETGVAESALSPLVKIGYRSPWTGKLVNGSSQPTNWNRQSYYMVIDVSAVVRAPHLGSDPSDPDDYKRRLAALAELLLIAADWNGEVYWRHLTTFLDTNRSVESTAQAALAGGIGASFISPVLGAALSGSALLLDTFVIDYTASFNSETYPALRAATSTYREAKRTAIFQRIRDASGTNNHLHDVLQLAYDYAFSYSIRGALAAVQEQGKELDSFLKSGTSSWQPLFDQQSSAMRRQRRAEDELRLNDPAVSEKDKKEIRERHQREDAARSPEERLQEERKRKELEEATIERLNKELERLRLEVQVKEAAKNASQGADANPQVPSGAEVPPATDTH